MFACRYAIFSAFFFWAACAQPGMAADPASPAGGKNAAPLKPVTAARFPERVARVYRQLDGSSICVTFKRVLWSSAASPTAWSDVTLDGSNPLRADGGTGETFEAINLRPVGGERGCAYFAAAHQGWSLYALEAGKPMRKVCKLSHAVETSRPGMVVVAFATKAIGAIGNGANLLLTSDGGATWHPTQPLVGGQIDSFEWLQWVSPTKLLAGAGDGSIQLLERVDAGSLRSVWKASFESWDEGPLLLDGDYVWVIGSETLHRLKIADGRIASALKKPDISVCAAAACHGFLLLCEAESVNILALNANGTKFANVGKVRCEEAAAILPLEGQKCLVIKGAGDALSLSLRTRQLSPLRLQVSAMPPPLKAADPAQPSDSEIRTLFSLWGKVPEAKTNAILHESEKKLNLTPRERTAWCIEEFKRAIKQQGGPIALPPPPTEEELEAEAKESRIQVDLGEQIPFALKKTIVAEAVKNTKLTDKERTQWIIKKYREYLATHKPDPDVNRTDATHEELVAMWALGAKVPDADRNVILEERDKKTEMTDLQKTRWATEQFRKYIDEHKPKDDEEKKNAKD